MKAKINKHNSWASYYNNVERHEGDKTEAPQQNEQISISKDDLERVAELITLASYTLTKHGIKIRHVTENILHAEEELLAWLSQEPNTNTK